MEILYTTTKSNDYCHRKIAIVDYDGNIYPFVIDKYIEKHADGNIVYSYAYHIFEYFGRSKKEIAVEDIVNSFFKDTPIAADPDFYFDHP